MNDQASHLRRLAGLPGETGDRSLPALAITGGKGGVGKTCVAVNLAVILGQMGCRPLLVDCDLGLANADVLLGLNPAATLYDVLQGRNKLGEVVTSAHGIDLLPAASGRDELTRLSNTQMDRLLQALGLIGERYDLLIFDTAAGIAQEVLDFLLVSKVVLAVLTPDPTSLTDAYALIKVLEGKRPGTEVRILVNQTADEQEARQCFNRLNGVCKGFLGRDLHFAGWLASDRGLRASVRARRPAATDGDGPLVQGLRRLALRMKNEHWRC